mmetsp:Transcript_6911/g.8775  ORF Transcript_6911/g.8775 Transcript_6911/m.8775 type:complete len:168 (-) Transcript_6911:2-505(-)
MSTDADIILNPNSSHLPECPSVNESNANGQHLKQKTKGKKLRKEQSDDDYILQKLQFYSTGPTLNTDDWLYDPEGLDLLDNSKKTDRVKMLHACEKSYYQKDYNKCLEMIRKAENLFGVQLENEEDNEGIKSDFESSGKKTRKSAKVDRHIVELLHIKERCHEKLNI